LAPEHPFPAALNDSYAALAWVARSAEVIGMRLGALAVGGSSAGANLAAAACLMAREAGGPAIIRQVLVYPVLDAEMSHPSYLTCGNGYQLTAAMMAAYIDAYAPNGTDRTNPLLSPLHAPSLAGLPPAHIVVADCDPLHDEVCAYAVKLKRNGVAVIQSNFIGVMHGFFGQAGVLSQARVAQKAVCDDLAEHLQSSD
jgi:acetyl esterase